MNVLQEIKYFFTVNISKAREHLPPLEYSLDIVQLTSFGFSAGHVVQNHRQNIVTPCVINGESTPFVRHIGFSVVKKKAAYHSAGSNVHDFLHQLKAETRCEEQTQDSALVC